jgi:hypothetical protein
MMEFAAYCTSGMGVQALPALALMDSSSLVQAYGGQLSGAAYTHPQQVMRRVHLAAALVNTCVLLHNSH